MDPPPKCKKWESEYEDALTKLKTDVITIGYTVLGKKRRW